MPELPASPIGETSQPPQKPPFWSLNKVLALLTVLLLTYLAGAGFYLWKTGGLPWLKQAPKEVIQAPSTIDILSFPSWTGFPGVSRTEDGPMVIAMSGGTELLVRNSNDFIEIGPNGFEVMTKIRTVASPDPASLTPVKGSIVLYNKSPNERGVLQLEVGLTNSNYLWLRFVDMAKEKPEERVKIYFAPSSGFQIEKVKTDEIKISFAKQDEEELLTIYDGTGEVVAKNIKLPRPFFSEESNQLYFGFYPVSGSNAQLAIMTVEYLKVKKR